MDIQNIELDKLYVSEHNVRKILVDDDDETTIRDLADNIKEHNLINPITVRKVSDDSYEIIAGQRRYLAVKSLRYPTIQCNVINVTDKEADIISLTENVHRNAMTNVDKVKSYMKLYQHYDYNLKVVSDIVGMSPQTLKKYITIASLPDKVIELLDSKDSDKVTIETAIALTKVSDVVDKYELALKLSSMTSFQSVEALRDFVRSKCTSADDIDEIKEIIKDQNLLELLENLENEIRKEVQLGRGF